MEFRKIYEDDNLAIDKKVLQKVLTIGDTIDGLNPNRIAEAAKILFDKNGYIQSGEYYQQLINNYDGLNLGKHGLHYTLDDIKCLLEKLPFAIDSVRTETGNRCKEIFILGSGADRMHIPIVCAAQKLGIEKITFNDLIPDNIDTSRETIKKEFGNAEKVEDVDIEYITGDFLEIAKTIQKKFSAILSLWYVTPEIARFDNVENFRKTRKQLYDSIYACLDNRGMFIEEIPSSESIGYFYYLVRLKTYAVLHELGILDGENHNLIITDYANEGKGVFPYHIRVAEPNGTHNEILKSSGMDLIHSEIRPQAKGVVDSTSFHNMSQNLLQELPNKIASNTFEQVIDFIDRKQQGQLIKPSRQDSMGKMKKICLYQATATPKPRKKKKRA